jgi:hypothetical protein
MVSLFSKKKATHPENLYTKGFLESVNFKREAPKSVLGTT